MRDLKDLRSYLVEHIFQLYTVDGEQIIVKHADYQRVFMFTKMFPIVILGRIMQTWNCLVTVKKKMRFV